MANEKFMPATVTGTENSHGTGAPTPEACNSGNPHGIQDAVDLNDCIRALKKGRKFHEPREIKAAKRKLPLAQLMERIGDGAFVSRVSIASPFHPTERPAFKLHQTRRGIFFACCGKCGHAGDQIDYLKARFSLTTGEAIAVFCRLAETSTL